jgi:hypothetical protein
MNKCACFFGLLLFLVFAAGCSRKERDKVLHRGDLEQDMAQTQAQAQANVAHLICMEYGPEALRLYPDWLDYLKHTENNGKFLNFYDWKKLNE